MIKRILVATDGSKSSVKALGTAIELAKGMAAKLMLMTVLDNRLFVGRTVSPDISPTGLAEPVDDYLMQVAGAYLADASNQCSRNGIEAEMTVRSGHPVDEILKEAKRSKADLLVMGSHGHSGIAAVMGSVTYGVLHGDSTIPVLVVRK